VSKKAYLDTIKRTRYPATVYIRNLLNMLRDMVIVVDVKPSIQPRSIIIDAPTTTYL
jgi:hypothetical protein